MGGIEQSKEFKYLKEILTSEPLLQYCCHIFPIMCVPTQGVYSEFVYQIITVLEKVPVHWVLIGGQAMQDLCLGYYQCIS